MVTRLMGNKEGKGEGGKGNRDGDSDNVGDGDGDDNNGKGNGDAIVRPTPTTTFDIQGGRGQQLPLSRAPRVTLGDNGQVLVVPFREIWHQQQIFL